MREKLVSRAGNKRIFVIGSFTVNRTNGSTSVNNKDPPAACLRSLSEKLPFIHYVQGHIHPKSIVQGSSTHYQSILCINKDRRTQKGRGKSKGDEALQQVNSSSSSRNNSIRSLEKTSDGSSMSPIGCSGDAAVFSRVFSLEELSYSRSYISAASLKPLTGKVGRNNGMETGSRGCMGIYTMRQ